ncbi:hypothetical protein DFH06DRAFT_1200719 [Mycena polygramma]|nr:hypothetical protein DFH06DRAFT_1200719 [Mycena polygramma]
MKKAQSVIGGRTKSKSSARRPTSTPLKVTYNVSEIPPELWATIASFATRHSLARLCSASHEFYSKFSPLLYGRIIDPPLTAAQSLALVRTLSEARTPFGQPHPAERIQQLSLTDGRARRDWASIKERRKATTDSLRNMYRLIPGNESMSGSLLRVLHWDLAAGMNELGAILGAPGHFPNLKELRVSTSGENNNFNFIQIGGLEVLGLTLDLHPYEETYEEGNKLCYKLAEALQMLSSSSPLLHTLLLKLEIPFAEDEFPYSGFSDLVAALNLVHLRLLQTLNLSINVDPDIGDMGFVNFDQLPTADFCPFLASNTTISALTLSVLGTKLAKDTSFLPRLRSFEGSFEDSAIICDHQRQLETLVIRLIHRMWSDNLLPSFRTLPLPSRSSLTKLRILAVDNAGSTEKLTNELSPASFAELVSSFPNFTDLDVCISKRMVEYREKLNLLANLKCLRLREYRTTICTHWECDFGDTRTCPGPKTPVTRIFPASDYVAEFALLLPSLPQLARIEINILGDHVSQMPEGDDDVLFEPAQVELEYSFSVIRKPGKPPVVSTDARIVSDTRRCFC